MAGPYLIVGHCSTRGGSHEENEDAFSVDRTPSGTAVVVADGMGGRQAGASAARIVVNTVTAALYEPQSCVPAALRGAMERAHQKLQELADPEGGPRRLGAACAVAIVQQGRVFVGNSGDVRVYRIPSSGGIIRLTLDHTVLQERVDAGEVTWSESHGHPDGRILRGFLGQRDRLVVSIDEEPLPLSLGDRLLVCTDGLGSVARDSEIGQVGGALSPMLAAEKLVELARQRGSRDDTTVVVAEVTDDENLATRSLAGAASPIASREPSVARPLPKRTAPRRILDPRLWLALGLVSAVLLGYRIKTCSEEPGSSAGLRPQANLVAPPEGVVPGAAPRADAAVTTETEDAGAGSASSEGLPPRTIAEALQRHADVRTELMTVLQGRHRQELLAYGTPPSLAPDETLPKPLPSIFDSSGDQEARALALRQHLEDLVLAGDAEGLRRLDAEMTFRARRPDMARVLLRMLDSNPEPLLQRWALEHLGQRR